MQHKRDMRLWQYRPDGEAKLFACREDIPAGEGWRDLPFTPEEIEAHGAQSDKQSTHSSSGANGPASEGNEGSGNAQAQDGKAVQASKNRQTGKGSGANKGQR